MGSRKGGKGGERAREMCVIEEEKAARPLLAQLCLFLFLISHEKEGQRQQQQQQQQQQQ